MSLTGIFAICIVLLVGAFCLLLVSTVRSNIETITKDRPYD